ncbi:MAG: VOC family protein [Roseiflexaceae bacterium]|nr:VOC family protein [Roseiflexaceae bacterium]
MQVFWVEIPAVDLERAMAFYQTVFKLQPTEIIADATRRITILISPTPEGRVAVALNQTQNFPPSASGPLVYLHVDEPLAQTLSRIEGAGGQVTLVEPEEVRGAFGKFATILDSEGNALVVHSGT